MNSDIQIDQFRHVYRILTLKKYLKVMQPRFFAGISESVTKPLSVWMADTKMPKKYKVNISTEGDRKKKRDRRRIRPELSSFIYVCYGRRSPYFSILLYLWISLITTGIEYAYYGCVIFFDEKRNFCKISKLVHSLTAYLMKWIIEFEIFSDDLMRLIIEHDFFLQIIQ